MISNELSIAQVSIIAKVGQNIFVLNISGVQGHLNGV
jgi:hypothetical protein